MAILTVKECTAGCLFANGVEILGITKTWFGGACKIYPEQKQIDRHGKESKVTKLNDGAVLLHPAIPPNETYYIVGGKYYTQVYARVLVRHIKF